MAKLRRNQIAAIVFGILMVGSTASYAIIQAYNFFGSPKQQQTAALPSSNIVQGQLSSDVEQLIISKYGTVVQFYYSPSCLNCLDQKQVLESFTSQNTNQVFLEEIQSQNQIAQNIIMKSYRDTKTLTDANANDIQNAFCDVMLQPPAQCALRSLNTS